MNNTNYKGKANSSWVSSHANEETFERERVRPESLKGVLLRCEDKLTDLNTEMNAHKQGVNDLKTAADVMFDELKADNGKAKEELNKELNEKEQKMREHFLEQKKKNLHFQSELAKLRKDETKDRNTLSSIEQRLNDLEMMVGFPNNQS